MRTWKYGAVLALALAACGGRSPTETGSVSLTISMSGASSASQALRSSALTTVTPSPGDATANVSSIVVSYTGRSGGSKTIDPTTNPMTLELNNLPAGAYTFSAVANDGSTPPVALFRSANLAVNVYKNQMTAVALILQQVAPGGTAHSVSPLISGITVSNATPTLGGTVALTASVLDPLPATQLTYLWTASCSTNEFINNGTVLTQADGEKFTPTGSTTALTTNLTSFCTGDETITFRVTETGSADGATASVSFRLKFAPQGTNVGLEFNLAPDILSLGTNDNRQPAFGGQIHVFSEATDMDHDDVRYVWRDSCGGSFDSSASQNSTWTAPSAPPHGTVTAQVPIRCALFLEVTDSRGGRNSGWMTVAVGEGVQQLVPQLPYPRFAFVANKAGNSISAYRVNVNTGALASVSTTALTEVQQPTSIAADAPGQFLYVVGGNDRIASYSVDAAGTLTQVGTALATGRNPQQVVVDPSTSSGQYVYVINHDDATISTYRSTAGALSSVGSPVTLRNIVNPFGFALDATGKYGLVAGNSSNNFAFYTGFERGSPTRGPFAVLGGGVGPRALVVDPSNRFVYAVNDGDSTITGAAILWRSSPGIMGSPFATLPTGSSPIAVVVEPSSKFVYVANAGDNSVSIYSIDSASGALTSVGKVDAGAAPSSAAVDPSGKFLYVTNSGAGTVSIFSIDGVNGALTLASGAAPATGAGPGSIAITGGYTPPIAYLAGRGTDHSITALTLDVSGTATTTQTVHTDGGILSLAVDPKGRFAYATINPDVSPYTSDSVLVFSIEPFTGALTQTGSIVLPPTAPIPPTTDTGIPAAYHVAVDPSGKFAYVADYRFRVNGQVVGRVLAYRIDQATGSLTYVNEDVNPLTYQIAVDPSGQFLYAMANNGYGLSTYRIHPDTGAITIVTNPAWADPKLFRITGESGDLGIDPFGRFVFTTTTNQTNSAVNALTIDSQTGLPTSMSAYAMPRSINCLNPVVDPTGRFAYAIGDNLPKIFEFSIDPATGALTNIGTIGVPGFYGVFGLGMDPSGAFLYATTDLGPYINSEPGTLLTFAIDPSAGTLTPVNVVAPATGYHPVRMSILPARTPWRYAPVATPVNPTPTTFTVGGTVTGLSGTIVLQNNGGSDLSVSTSSFTFSVAQGGSYDVTVMTQPSGQTCAVTNGSGQNVQANVTNVAVTCTDDGNPPPTGFTLGGTVSGVPSLSSIVLHNDAEDRPVTGSGSFTFANAVSPGGSYSVAVLSYPSFLSCTVTNGSGQNVQANVTDVAVACASNTAGLGATCNAPGTIDTAACGSGLYTYCHAFGALGNKCTMSCQTDGDCPVGGNDTQKCNTDHVCRP